MDLICVKDVRKVYRVDREKIVALGRVNLRVEKGEICCVLGSSGSGKSTLLNIMAGLEKPSRGRIIIGGKDVTDYSEKQWALYRQKNIGFVFQAYNLVSTHNALENVAMPLVFRGMVKKERLKRSASMLKAVGLKSRMLHRPSQMSGGQQQRVGIARAFVARPKIVFADEPTGNLDSKTGRGVMELMVSMAKKYGETLVIVTHDIEMARFADRIVTIHDGYIIKDEKNDQKAPAEENAEGNEEMAI